jgi:hypothetical protein
MPINHYYKKTYVFLLLFALCSLSSAQEANTQPKLNAKEKKFRDALSHSTLVGTFSVDGKEHKNGFPKDRYDITTVEKTGENKWVTTARIRYGENDVRIPVPVTVDFAGDTPVLSLKKVTIPGLGTFSTHLLITGDRYAGTWQHDAVGGHMWGKIEKTKKEEPKKE